MARPSKLTADQWEQIKTRRALGESAADLSREFGISETSISKRVSQAVPQISQLAKQIVDTRTAMNALPLADQFRVMKLADKLMEISSKLGEAAEYGADTAARMSALANKQIKKINADDPMETADVLQSIAGLTKIANEASIIPLKTIALSQSQKESAEDAPPPARVVVEVVSARKRKAVVHE